MTNVKYIQLIKNTKNNNQTFNFGKNILELRIHVIISTKIYNK